MCKTVETQTLFVIFHMLLNINIYMYVISDLNII